MGVGWLVGMCTSSVSATEDWRWAVRGQWCEGHHPCNNKRERERITPATPTTTPTTTTTTTKSHNNVEEDSGTENVNLQEAAHMNIINW